MIRLYFWLGTRLASVKFQNPYESVIVYNSVVLGMVVSDN